jgi:uncharacterized protein YutE (UPF0331/DUF86 family)
MDTPRLKRYEDKLAIIHQRSGEIEEWKEDFYTEERTKLACYKAFQEISESSMDILAMMLKDSGGLPKDDYSNIDLLQQKKLLDADMAETLKEANGLRNRVIHHYNGTSEKIAYESMVEMLPKLGEFAEAVERWLQKQ